MNSQNLYNALIDSNIVGAIGEISFEMHGIKTLVKDSSVVGNIIQEWLMSFMDLHQISYRFPANSQEFPDYFLGDLDEKDLLEVKCFKTSPNFDVANFAAYCKSIKEKPYRLNADYLIFEYAVIDAGIEIKNIWLKKVWQIVGPSERTTVNMQIKKNVMYNIRPVRWYSDKAKFKPFQTRKEFVEALRDVLKTTQYYEADWYSSVIKKFKEQTGQEL